MKNSILMVVLLVGSWPLFAQNNAMGLDTIFPFSIPLLTIDSSTVLNSKTVMRIPQKEKQRKPTVIAFWLTTCVPCQRELSTYTSLYPEWKKQAEFNLFAISTDFPKNFRSIARIAQENQFPFKVYWDRDRLFRYVMPGGLNGLPQVFIFDKNGKLAYQHKGFRPGDEVKLFEQIKGLQ